MRILVVEDEKKVASFIKKGLQQEGYAADAVYDGLEAVNNATAFDYDLVILDLMLPRTVRPGGTPADPHEEGQAAGSGVDR